MSETPDLNFSATPQYGPVQRAEIHFNDWDKFCRGRRVLMVIVKTKLGLYVSDFRNPEPTPADLWPVPPCEQVSVDDGQLE